MNQELADRWPRDHPIRAATGSYATSACRHFGARRVDNSDRWVKALDNAGSALVKSVGCGCLAERYELSAPRFGDGGKEV